MKTNIEGKKRISYRLIIFICILSVLIIAHLIILSVSRKLKSDSIEQFAAERWMNNNSDIHYAQISCFMTSDAGFTTDNVLSLNRSYDDRMLSESISSQIGARLWIHAYSGNGNVSVDAATNIPAQVTAIGGDFFYFHNIPLLSGNYFTDDSLNSDHVIINESLAWQLFGSNDIIGKDIFINDVPYNITGVSKDMHGENQAANPHIYMQYDVYQRMDNSAFISCYEVLLPNPISDFALNIVKEYVRLNQMEHEIIQNTERFNLINTFKVLSNLKERNIKTSKVLYPEWENTARITEYKLARLLSVRIIISVMMLTVLIVMIIVYRTNISDFFEKTVKIVKTKAKNTKIAKAIEERRRKEYEKKEYH